MLAQIPSCWVFEVEFHGSLEERQYAMPADQVAFVRLPGLFVTRDG